VRRHWKAVRLEPLLLPGAILHDVENRGSGPNRRELDRATHPFGGDRLDLWHQHRAAAREVDHGVGVIEGRADGARRRGAGRRALVGVEDMHVVTHRTGRERRHATELAAAEEA